MVKMEEYAKEQARENNTDGVILMGVNADTKQEIRLTVGEYNYGALYLGTTGSGKTRAILANAEYCMEAGMPFIMVDGKGSPDLPKKLKYLADKHKRKLKVFTLKPEDFKGDLISCLAAYHPFSTGTFTEWKNRIMSLFPSAEGRGQIHYAINEEKTLNLILDMLYLVSKDKVDLVKLYRLINNPNAIRSLAEATGDTMLIEAAENINAEKLGDIAGALELFIRSSYGHLFDTENNSNVIKVQESIINNEIVLFMFDSSSYKEDTKKIAKMIINDINSAFSTMEGKTGSIKPCFCVFDEFASYASSNLADTLTMQRSNGMHAIVGTQGLTTVSLVDKETARVAEELVACCGTYLILQLQHMDDVDKVANLIGTRDGHEVTSQIDISEGQGATGMGSSKVVDEFIIHPKVIRKLLGTDGTGVLVRKTYGVAPVKIIVKSTKTSD